jgi:hypothetical protein
VLTSSNLGHNVSRHFLGLQRCRNRRRIKLPYHLRVRCLTDCVRYGVQREKRQICNQMTKPGSERKDASETTQARQCGPNEITLFLQGFDPLLHYRQLVDWNIGRASEFLNISNRFVVLYTAAPPAFALSANNPLVNKSSIDRSINSDREVPIVIDTGASWSVTPCIQDFVSEITSSLKNSNLSMGLLMCLEAESLNGTFRIKTA